MTPGSRTALAAVSATGAVGLSAAVWGTCIERYLFTVRRHDLALLPPGSPSLTVLHLSDAHMAPWQRRKQAWICLLYTSPSPRDVEESRMPSSA